MAVMVDDDVVEPMARMLVGAIDVDDGPTVEQRAVLHAIVSGAWQRDDLDVDGIDPLTPDAAADALPPTVHHRARELLALLELCRHPLTETQTRRVDEYAAALGEDSVAELALARDLVRGGAAAVMFDYQRYFDDSAPDCTEPSSTTSYPGSLDEPDQELAARLRALHDLPEGTLGHEYVELYVRNGLTLPGDDPRAPLVFIAHDMSHVIAGYEPTGPGEIALGAMQLAVHDTEEHWIGLLGNLAVHEGGYLTDRRVVPERAAATRPGTAELVATAIHRGARCTESFDTADHLALVDQPIDEVRARFGVPAPDRSAGPNAVPR